jgi:hypothetical protein
MNYKLSTPAINGETVTEGHAQYCRDNGHMTHTIDGVDQGFCPRCGECLIDEPTREAAVKLFAEEAEANRKAFLAAGLELTHERLARCVQEADSWVEYTYGFGIRHLVTGQ